jgi:ribosomal protein L20
VLSDLAVREPDVFKTLVAQAQAALVSRGKGSVVV